MPCEIYCIVIVMHYILTTAIIATTLFEINVGQSWSYADLEGNLGQSWSSAGRERSLDHSWSYNDIDGWSQQCQTGKQQSPINIDKQSAIRANIPVIQLTNYNQKMKAILGNNGHTVDIHLFDESDASALPTISGGPLRGNYTLRQIHFHWDSEHTIDGHRYALECHFVHLKSNQKDNATTFEIKNGVVVMAVMYDIGHSIKQLRQVGLHIKTAPKYPGQKILRKGIKLEKLLPRNLGSYFAYRGSLTTPECDEVVTWIIPENKITITRKELSQLTNIYTSKGALLRKNYRPLQELNGRIVLYRYEREHNLYQTTDW